VRLGLLTDIHEQVDPLRSALARFRQERVEQVVVIGDIFEMGERIEETCRLLAEAGAVGVWGNHDYGLACEPSELVRTKYGEAVIGLMTSLRPRLDIAGCHFTHVEPWLNPEKIADLWYYEGPPDEHRQLKRIFDAVPNRLMFAGHFHKWLLAAPDGIEPWFGDRPVCLKERRYFVVVGALCDGRYAIFDTDSAELTPFNAPRFHE
jgi:predicted phosphodiesterase